MVWVSLVYMDTQTQELYMARVKISDIPGWSGYPWCTRILRHRVLFMGGHSRIIRDGLGILGVHGYSDIGVIHG